MKNIYLGRNSENVWEALTPKRHANSEPGLPRETNYFIQNQSQWQPEDALALTYI